MGTNRKVVYVEFGYHTAREEWEEVGLPAYERFKLSPTRATAMEVAIHAWHAQDWLWHEVNPGVDTHSNPAFAAFRKQLIADCQELEWVGDIADAAKHRGLGRPKPPQVERMNLAQEPKLLLWSNGRLALTTNGKGILVGGRPLTIELTDGSKHEVAQVLERVVEFWQARFAATLARHPEQTD